MMITAKQIHFCALLSCALSMCASVCMFTVCTILFATWLWLSETIDISMPLHPKLLNGTEYREKHRFSTYTLDLSCFLQISTHFRAVSLLFLFVTRKIYIKIENQKSRHLLFGSFADSSHVSSSSSSSKRQAHSVITTETRLITSRKDKWEEWG